ncbi:hypothetical protein CO608_01790 [Lysobacteraceae bacterium NML08-0793]|nr:hypothetical protein CO608_01790 [Xanthomonadaceae bacterium NML08-0793]
MLARMRFFSAKAASLALAVVLSLVGCGHEKAPELRFSGLITSKRLTEISGIAASRRTDGLLWAIDDGGNPAQLHAISRRGRHLGSLNIAGVEKVDWEDLASFELDGKPYLMIADTGDNGGIRKTLQLYVIAEPDSETLAQGGTLTPAWTINFRWPDGARDCEAVAVDAANAQILLVSKKRQPPQLFTLPLHPARGESRKTETAALAGTLAGVPQASARERRENPSFARLRSQVTAADIAPQRDAIAVLTYDNLLIYRRRPQQSWAQALASAPKIIALRFLPQAEAVAWSRGGGGLHVTSELSPASLMYLSYARSRAEN